ncbi:MAG: hypothetical protein VKP62_15125, partial [Candidatus Sericytochromatia bacterium]|nr:hypothetical protein [Candidatus Sericytochromatia bacterium]
MSFPHGSSRHRLAQGLRGLLSDQGCRLGRAALACALLSTSGCQGSIGRATLTMAEAAPTALQALVDQETHGESHPNNVLPFLASEEGGRSLQAISEEDARPEAPSAAPIQVKVNADAELLIRDPKVVDDPVRTNGKGAWSFATLMTR